MPSKKGKLYSLTELSKKSGVSMPTLQRYKKLYQDRIPSEGSGRTQKYPEAAIDAVQELKAENLKKRGRRKAEPAKKASAGKRAGKGAKRAPRKRAAASKRPKKADKPAAELLSLSEVSRITGISYPTLSKYSKLHRKRIPSEGSGRKRRYHPEAVDVFREIRAASRRGPAKRKPSGTPAKTGGRGAAASTALAQRVKSLEKKVDAVLKQLKAPIQVTLKRG